MEPGSGGKAASLHREDREVTAWQTLGNAERQRTQGNTGARASAKHGHGWNWFTGSGSAGCSLEGCGDSVTLAAPAAPLRAALAALAAKVCG